MTKTRLFWRRAGLRFQKLAIGYGYRTWPCFIAVIVLALLGAGLGYAAGHTAAPPTQHHAAYRNPPAAGRNGEQCSAVELVALGVHVPFLSNLASGNCMLDTTTTAGQTYEVTIWFVDALAWAAATLAVAGYTGLVRQT